VPGPQFNLAVLRLGTASALFFQAPIALRFGMVPALWFTTLVMGAGFAGYFIYIFGWFVDKRGKRATLMVVGASLCIPCYLLLAFTFLHPIVSIFFIGMSLSLVPVALWAAIPMMVPASRLGTAFGTIGWIQNVGLMLFPWIAGKVADAHTTVKMVAGEETMHIDYTMTVVLLAGLASAGLMAALLLKWVDGHRTEGLSIEGVIKT